MIDFMKMMAFRAGEICLESSSQLSERDLDFKGKRDLVTSVDKKVEEYIIQEIVKKYPHHDILGEETGLRNQGSEHRWVIDPIDGTVSYYHGQPYFAISLAYQRDEKTVAGVVYAPALGQMFTAETGKGSWLNGSTPLKVSTTQEMINCVLATGFACLRAGRVPNNLYHLNHVLPHIRDIRRCGSAAIDLAYVAAGKVDGFWEYDLNLYDIAAGVLLVQEAGGLVTDMKGGGSYPEDGIVATNRYISNDLIELLSE